MAMGLLALAYIIWAFCFIANILWKSKVVRFLIKGLIYIFVAAAAYSFVIFAYSHLPSFIQKIILVLLVGIAVCLVYNFSIAKWEARQRAKQAAEFEVIHKQMLKEGLEFLQPWLRNLPVHYYDFEKEKFVHWLFDSNLLLDFHQSWDEAYRLHMMGDITGRYYVCHLDLMSEEQKKARRDAAWNAKRREQSRTDKERNAKLKVARKGP